MGVSYKWYAYKVNVRLAERAILKRLAEVDPEDAERSNEALTEAFHFFDADGSGDISHTSFSSSLASSITVSARSTSARPSQTSRRRASRRKIS